jgi:histidinol-phosphatase (PHP family)
MFMEDYHLHTELSMDSTEKLSNMCEAALLKNISEIAITEHFDEEVPGKAYQCNFDSGEHLRHVEAARTVYQGKLKILLGIEIGQPHFYPQIYTDKLAENNYDFIISSMHVHPDDGDYYSLSFTGLNFKEMYDRYLDETIKMLTFNNFDILGHITYPVRYVTKNMREFDVMQYEKKLAEIMKRLIDMDKGLEVNTSTYRRGENEPVLDENVYKLYYSLGGRVLTVGSDAH